MKPVLSLIRQIYSPGRESFTFPVDRYRAWVVLMVERGRFRWQADGLRGESGHGEFLICPPGVDLARAVLESPMDLHFLEFEWKDARPVVLHRRVADLPRFASTLAVLRLLASRQPDRRAAEYGSHFLCDLLMQAEMETDWLHLPPCRTPEDRAMHNLDAAMRSGFRGLVDLAAEARRLRLTPPQLSRRFRKIHGCAPRQRLMQLRVAEARRLLGGTNMTVAEVAEAVGYDDPLYFSRWFRRLTGNTPTGFRRSVQV